MTAATAIYNSPTDLADDVVAKGFLMNIRPSTISRKTSERALAFRRDPLPRRCWFFSRTFNPQIIRVFACALRSYFFHTRRLSSRLITHGLESTVTYPDKGLCMLVVCRPILSLMQNPCLMNARVNPLRVQYCNQCPSHISGHEPDTMFCKRFFAILHIFEIPAYII